MTALVTKHLPLVAGAPEGIKKLRALILELAVRGRLVPQDSGDEPAAEILFRISHSRHNASSPKGATKAFDAANGFDGEPPFDLPNAWAWVRFGGIAQHNSGKTLDKGRNAGVPRDYITTSNLYWGRFDLSSVRQMLIRDDELERCTARKNDLLICEGGEAGRAAVWTDEKEVCFQNHIHRARMLDGISPHYAYRVFERLNASGEISQYRKGVGISNMSSKSLASIPFPLPPIKEQHRIVAKVDELMALCDRLEADQADAEAAHAQLVQALLDSLTQATDAADFRASWQRLSEHFHTLFTTEASIDALKQAVLQLAVMGKVVPQDPSEGQACELIDLINAAKAQTSVRVRKNLETVPLDQVPFELPANWVWARIGQLALSTEYGLSEKTNNSFKGIPVLKMGDIQGGGVALDTTARVPEQTEGLPELYLESGDLLYNRTNSAELVGKTGIYRGPSNAFTFASYLIRIRFDKRMICPAYVNYVMNSPAFRQTQINPHLKQQCGQANVNGTIMRNMLVSLPPIAEQHRIVAKVDELMALCDQLKAQLAEARQQHAQLATALVEQAVA